MSGSPPLHPARDSLIAFGQGKLEADESLRVEQHLEVCRPCCETLLDLKDDTFIGLVRSAKQADVDANGTLVHLESTTNAEALGELPVELAHHPRYRIVELIGRGGMGNVYRAEHRLMNRPVAIKLINSELVKHPQAVERFRREAQAAAKLAHPNIVTAYDAEQAGPAHFLVMEFVAGTDLASVVQERGPLSVRQACECIRQAAMGLQHAHERGMVHRDIKPHNLMLTADGQVRILDFGLAGFASEAAAETISRNALASGSDAEQPDANAFRLISKPVHLTAVGSVMGTPDYMAPEQAADAHSADIRADIYSLGCTLYFLLTGKPPFEAQTVLEKLKAHIEHEPPALNELRDDLPAGLNDVVARMLAKDPADRFQSPRDVATILQSFTERSQPVLQTPKPTLGSRIAKWMLVPLVLAAGIVIYLATDTGQIEIDTQGIDLPGAKIVLLKGGQEYASFDVNATQEFQSIRAGEYEVRLRGAADDVKMNVWTKRGDTNNWGAPDDHEAKPIVLYRGGGLLIRVLRHEPQLATPTHPTAPEDPHALVDAGRFAGHQGSVSHAIVSPGGRYGISCGEDKTIRVWDIATQEEKRVLKGHEGSVYGLAISTDGKLLASGDNAKSIRLWNLETGEQVGELLGHTDAVTDLAFMPDRTHLLSAGFDDTLRLWHVAERKLVRTIDIGTKVEKMLPLPDGRRVMLSGAHTRGWGPITYDLEKGEKIDATPNAYSCMAVTADGRMLLIGSITGVLRVTDTDKGHLIVEMTDPRANVARDAAARDAAITPDGRFAITTTRENQMHLWDLHQGKLISTAEADTIGTVTLSPDGRFALTIGREGGVGVWRLPESVLEPIAATGPSDEARLQGKWVAVSGHARKEPLTAAQLAQLSITFDGDRVEIISHTGPPTPQAATFTINSNRDPQQIDFVAPNKSESMPGIYQFDGDRLKLALIDQDYSRPTNFDPDHRPDHLTATFERATVAATLGGDEREVLQAAEAFLAVIDEGRFGELFDVGSRLAQQQATRDQISQAHQQIRDTAGKVEKRTLRRVRLIDEFLGLPPGRYAAVQYASDFEKHKGLWESVLLNVDGDGQWRVNTYAATIQPLPLPEPKKQSGPATNEQLPQPTSPIPPAAVPAGANLILDPSFENTSPTLLPRGWSAWLDDGPDIRCEVVEGGRTGKHCLQIAGQGSGCSTSERMSISGSISSVRSLCRRIEACRAAYRSEISTARRRTALGVMPFLLPTRTASGNRSGGHQAIKESRGCWKSPSRICLACRPRPMALAP